MVKKTSTGFLCFLYLLIFPHLHFSVYSKNGSLTLCAMFKFRIYSIGYGLWNVWQSENSLVGHIFDSFKLKIIGEIWWNFLLQNSKTFILIYLSVNLWFVFHTFTSPQTNYNPCFDGKKLEYRNCWLSNWAFD